MGLIENKRDVLYSGALSTSKIDEVSNIIARALGSFSQSTREILRVRLTVETVMGIWVSSDEI